jgi:hypothetical protein
VNEEPITLADIAPELAEGPKTDLPLGHVRVKMTDIVPATRNPRRGSVADVVESLRRFGQHRDVVVQRSSGQVIVGNHLYLAAKTMGWDEIDAYVVDDDDHEALARAVADNATGDKATWDEAELADVLKETGAVPGFDEDDIAKLLKKISPEIDDEKVEPTYPLVARMNEHHDYVVIVCHTETDWSWLQTKLELQREKSYKSTAVATSHVVSVERLQELLG